MLNLSCGALLELNWPAMASWSVQRSLPNWLLAVTTNWPMSVLLTLWSFRVCWSSSGMLISNSPGLLTNATPLLGKTEKIYHIVLKTRNQDLCPFPQKSTCICKNLLCLKLLSYRHFALVILHMQWSLLTQPRILMLTDFRHAFLLTSKSSFSGTRVPKNEQPGSKHHLEDPAGREQSFPLRNLRAPQRTCAWTSNAKFNQSNVNHCSAALFSAGPLDLDSCEFCFL